MFSMYRWWYCIGYPLDLNTFGLTLTIKGLDILDEISNSKYIFP